MGRESGHRVTRQLGVRREGDRESKKAKRVVAAASARYDSGMLPCYV